MKLRYLTLLFSILFLSACAGSLKVNSDYDRSVNFSSFKTYTFLKVEMPNPLWNQRVIDAVDSALTAKGWTKVESGEDVGIVALGTTKNQQDINTFYSGFGPGWGYGYRGWGGMGMGTATTTVSNYKVGTLIVDLFDGKTKQIMWRGTATDTIEGSPDKNQKKLNNAVQTLFKDFPPGAASK